MKEDLINYANDLLDEKRGLLELKYYISDSSENLLQGFTIKLKTGEDITNIPLSARVLIRQTLLKEIDQLVKNIDKAIDEI